MQVNQEAHKRHNNRMDSWKDHGDRADQFVWPKR